MGKPGWELTIGAQRETYGSEDELLERLKILLIEVLANSPVAEQLVRAPDGKRMDLSIEVSLEEAE